MHNTILKMWLLIYITSNTPYNAPSNDARIILFLPIFLCSIIEHIKSDKKSILKFIANKMSAYIITKSPPYSQV